MYVHRMLLVNNHCKVKGRKVSDNYYIIIIFHLSLIYVWQTDCALMVNTLYAIFCYTDYDIFKMNYAM